MTAWLNVHAPSQIQADRRKPYGFRSVTVSVQTAGNQAALK